MRDGASLPILLKELRLSSMARVWETFIEKAREQGWSHEKFLAALCEQEMEERNQRRIHGYLKKAGLPLGRSWASFDFRQVEKLDKRRGEDLANHVNWVSRPENPLICGASGVGRTHLCAAIGYAL